MTMNDLRRSSAANVMKEQRRRRRRSSGRSLVGLGGLLRFAHWQPEKSSVKSGSSMWAAPLIGVGDVELLRLSETGIGSEKIIL